jgi:transcriptional regulator with XRE-family HTH domain
VTVGERLKQIRESKKYVQGDIEQRTGLPHCYTSHVKNGHRVPSLEMLEKYARPMEIELYQLFFESKGDKKPQDLNLPGRPAPKLSPKDAGIASRLSTYLTRMNERDKTILVNLARKMAAR